MKFSFFLSTTLLFMIFTNSAAQSGTEDSTASQNWVKGALNAALCEKPPCKPQSIASIVGPMRTEPEWRKLAENGDEMAQSQQCSSHGFKNDVDPAYYLKIVSWCRNEAEKGSLPVEYRMAKSYANGQVGYPQSWEEAYFWYAVRIGKSSISPIERDETAKHLTAQQVKVLDERVTKWKVKLCASSPTERNAKVMREWHC